MANKITTIGKGCLDFLLLRDVDSAIRDIEQAKKEPMYAPHKPMIYAIAGLSRIAPLALLAVKMSTNQEIYSGLGFNNDYSLREIGETANTLLVLGLPIYSHFLIKDLPENERESIKEDSDI